MRYTSEMRMEALRLFEENERLQGLLLRERAITAVLVQALREIETMSRDPLTVNEARKIINATLLMIPLPAGDAAGELTK